MSAPNSKTVYQTSPEGIYIGETISFESPLEPGVFLIPSGAIEIKPPNLSFNQFARWTGSEWSVVEIVITPTPTPTPTSTPIPTPTPTSTFTPTPTPLSWENIRSQRDYLLSQSDWTQVADAPLTVEQKAAWAAYRSALRNVPQTYSEPSKVVWPTAP